MGSLYLGIDLGTTVLKAAVFSKDGACHAEASARLPVITGRGGQREQNVAALGTILLKVLRETIRKSGQSADEIVGIGIAAQGGSFIPADAATGTPRAPMVLWNDMRGADQLTAIGKKRPRAFWHPLSYLDGPVTGVAKLAHHAALHPKWFARGTICAGAGAFLFHHLTGIWRQEAGHAIQLGCYNWKRDCLDLRGLTAAGLDIPMPAMRPGDGSEPLAAAMAKKLGLRAGIPVIGPYMDHEAGYRALRQVGKRPMQVSLGTAWVANAVLPAQTDRTLPLQIFMPALDAPGRFCVYPIRAGNQTWDWALATFLGGTERKHIQAADAMLAENAFPAAGLTALPFVYAANPIDHAVLGGVSFIGAGFDTTREDFLRATVAGLCYEFRRAVECAYPAGTCDAMILCGGTSRCPAIQQIIAALFPDIRVYLNPEGDRAGPLGAVAAFGVAGMRALPRLAAPGAEFRRHAREGYIRYMEAHRRLA